MQEGNKNIGKDTKAQEQVSLDEQEATLKQRQVDINKQIKDIEQKEKEIIERVKKVDKKDNNEFGDKIKSVVTKFSEMVTKKLEDLEDLATLELKLDPDIRMRHRLESIRKFTNANHLKIDGHWKTIAPRMHISNLTGRKINNLECEITFSVYEVDDENNKKATINYGDVELRDGSEVRRKLSAEYKITREVTEYITKGQEIKRKIVEVNK